MQVLQTIPQDVVALEGAVYNGTSFFTNRGDGQPIHPFTSVRTKQGTAQWPQFAPPHAVSTAVSLNARRSINTGYAELYMQCEVAGTTGASAPVVNYSQIGTTVVDGTVTWRVKGLHAFKGFSNWPARTNLLTYSEQFNNATWQKVNSTTLTPDVITSPNNTTSADELKSTASGLDNGFLRVPTTQSGSTVYTLSVYVKKGTANWFRVANRACGSTAAASAWFDLTNGVVGSRGANLTSHSIRKIGGGWYRCVIVGTTEASPATNLVDFVIATADLSTSANLNDTVYVWGAQLEAAAFASPYIATTTATVTRAATNLSLPTAGNIRGNDFGVDIWVIPGASGQAGWLINSQTDASNYTGIYRNPATLGAVKVVAATSYSPTPSTIGNTINEPYRVQAFFSGTDGVGHRGRTLGGNWTAWGTLVNTQPCPIGATVALAHLGGVGCPGNYPATRFVLHSDPKAELERLAAIDDAWVAGQI